MDMVVDCWVKCMIECTIQDIFTKGFAYFDMTSLGATVYIGEQA